MLPKIRVTATGMTTKGRSTLMRQKVLLRRLVSSAAAIAVATRSWGTAESRKMLRVLRSATQNWRWPSTKAKLPDPAHPCSPPSKSHACTETQPV